MDPDSSEKLLNILRSTLYLVEHYGKHEEDRAELCDLKQSMKCAISALEGRVAELKIDAEPDTGASRWPPETEDVQPSKRDRRA